MDKTVWVFHGAGGRFASGIFSNLEQAVNWTAQNKLTGLLTEYHCDMAVYDWAIENDFFEAKKEDEKTPAFIQKFTSASQAHYHFEAGGNCEKE